MSPITTGGRTATAAALLRTASSTASTPSGGDTLPGITVAGASKSFGRDAGAVRALAGVDLTVAPGEFVSLVGASDCGKSTPLRIVAGLDEPAEGRVRIGAFMRDAADAAPGGAMPVRNRLAACAYMPQRDMLLLEQFGVSGFDQVWPAALSGGMRQRVALARTVLTGRRALLLDEPFGALDALTRLEMQGWLLEVWARLGVTVLLVTHDLDEALHLSDRVYVMGARPGRIVDEVAVAVPRPRGEEIVATPEFARLKGRLLAAIRGTGGQRER